jgi:Meckel syndrome type 1 protein
MTQTTPPPSDDDLPDERELAALYARLPKVEPDASLDAAVLAEATRAMPVSRRPRWPVALASAAVLVLSVGVAWQVREQQPAPSAMRTAAAPPPSTPAPASPAAAGMRTADSIRAEAAPTQELRKSVAAAPAYKVGPPSHVGPAVHRIAPPAISAQMAPAPAAPEAAMVSAAPAATPAPAPAPEPRQYESAQPAPSGALREKMAAKVAADESDVPNSLGPDDRVGEIRRLLGSGDRAQVLRELNELRRRYPHYDLPQDLRDLNP